MHSNSGKIEDLELPSGGTVSFHSLDDLTGKDVRELRATRDVEGVGTFYNNMTEVAMRLLIADWAIPGREHVRTPRYDKKASNQISARDLVAIERHLMPRVKDLLNEDEGEDAEDRSPGSPSRPASE